MCRSRAFFVEIALLPLFREKAWQKALLGTMHFPGLPKFRGIITLWLARYVCACGTVRCKLWCNPGFRVRSVLKNAVKQGGCVWLRSRGGAGAAVQIFKRTASGAENLGNGSPEQCFSFRKPPPWCAEKPTKHKRNKRRERVGARPPGKIVLCRASHRTRAQPGRNVSAAQSATLCHPIKSGQSAWYPVNAFSEKEKPGCKKTLHRTGAQPRTQQTSRSVTAPRNLRRPGECMVPSEVLFASFFF